mgnify:CR=1 FL=1
MTRIGLVQMHETKHNASRKPLQALPGLQDSKNDTIQYETKDKTPDH